MQDQHDVLISHIFVETKSSIESTDMEDEDDISLINSFSFQCNSIVYALWDQKGCEMIIPLEKVVFQDWYLQLFAV